MIKLDNLNRQHDTIINEILLLEAEIGKGSSAIDTAAAALHISKLAGQLKIHLLEEDKILYPDLLKCNDKEIQDMANQYIKEMGDLAGDYTEFKTKFNTSNKINNNIELFITEGKQVIEALKTRITKEDKGLYHLIKEKNL